MEAWTSSFVNPRKHVLDTMHSAQARRPTTGSELVTTRRILFEKSLVFFVLPHQLCLVGYWPAMAVTGVRDSGLFSEEEKRPLFHGRQVTCRISHPGIWEVVRRNNNAGFVRFCEWNESRGILCTSSNWRRARLVPAVPVIPAPTAKIFLLQPQSSQLKQSLARAHHFLPSCVLSLPPSSLSLTSVFLPFCCLLFISSFLRIALLRSLGLPSLLIFHADVNPPSHSSPAWVQGSQNFRGCATLFNKLTFEHDIVVTSIHMPTKKHTALMGL